MNKDLWKFVADNGYRWISAISEYDDDFETVAEYQKIGGDQTGDIELGQYVAGWPG